MITRKNRLLSLPDDIIKEMTSHKIARMIGYKNHRTVQQILRSAGRKCKRKSKEGFPRDALPIADIINMRDQDMTHRSIAEFLSISMSDVYSVIVSLYPKYVKGAHGQHKKNQISSDMKEIIIKKHDQGYTFRRIGCELNISGQRVH